MLARWGLISTGDQPLRRGNAQTGDDNLSLANIDAADLFSPVVAAQLIQRETARAVAQHLSTFRRK
jgi:hypothetical protein